MFAKPGNCGLKFFVWICLKKKDFLFSVQQCLQNGSKILFVRTNQLLACPQKAIRHHQTRNIFHQEQWSKDVAPHLRPEHEFKVSKALIVSKLSRLELESHRNAHLSQPQLEQLIRNRGADYESFVYHHHLHQNFQQRVAQAFTDMGVEVQLANRWVS